MGCKYKKMDYDKSDYGMMDLSKEGNKSIKGLINKRVVVKRRSCKK